MRFAEVLMASASAGGGGLPAMAYESEAQAVFTAWTANGLTPTAARKYQVNRFFKRLKTAGMNIGNDFLQIAMFNHGVEAWDEVNWATPGTMNPALVGTPTAAANIGWTGSSGNYIESNVPANNIPRDGHAVFIWSNTSGNNASADAGVVQAGSTGFAVTCANASTTIAVRSSSAASSGVVGSTSYWDATGFMGFSRPDSANVDVYKNSQKVAGISLTSVAVSTAQTFQYLGINNNGTHGTSTRQEAIGIIAKRHLTQAEVRVLHDAVRTYVNSVRYGEIEVYDPGVQPATVTADHVIYGVTAAGAAYAYECVARGETVAIVASFRERTVGSFFGMSANGLGAVDLKSSTAHGGLARTWIEDAVTTWEADPVMQPDVFHRTVRAYLDPTRGDGLAVPIYLSEGLASVAKTGAAITSFTTQDGRTFVGEMFHDATYGGELMVAAGCDYIIGREAAGASAEADNGYRGPSGATSSPVDPYVTPGNAGSGFIFGVEATPALSVGDADADRMQAMNFRLTFTSNLSKGFAHTTTPPPDYTESRYEMVGRAFDAGVYTAIEDGIFNANTLPGADMYDFNNKSFFSTDYVHNNATKRFYDALYAKDYETAEEVWQEHRNYVLGLIHYLARTSDARISAGIKTEMLGFRWPVNHYYDRDPNDEALEAYMPGVLYQREGARMVGDFILNANDMVMTDGTTPRSTNTASMFAYTMDSHAFRRIVRPDSGGAVGEGGLNIAAGGANLKGPLPIEIYMPKAAQVTNLTVSFAVSATHLAMSAARMEAPSIQGGQSCAVLATLARDAGLGVQAYIAANAATFRTEALLGQGATAPVLTQVN